MSEATATDLESIAAEARGRVAACADLAGLEALKVELFGKKGAITAQLKSLGGLAPDARREAGARINAVRDALAAQVGARRAELERAELERKLEAGRIDVTQPGRGQQPGGLHPVSRVRRRIEALFRNVADDPSIAGRTADYDIVARMAAERPLFGQGLFTWVPFYFRTIDNQALMLVLELGIVGTVAFVVLVGTHLAVSLTSRSRLTDPRARHLAMAVAAALAGILSSFITFDALSFRMVAGLTFFFAGLAGAVWHLSSGPVSARA